MGLRKKKKCVGKFRFPECLTKACRHECVDKFNNGRHVKLVLGGVKKEKKEAREVFVGTKDIIFDSDTLNILFSEILLGLPSVSYTHLTLPTKRIV